MEKLAIDGGKPVFEKNLPTIENKTGRMIGAEEYKQVKEVLDSGTLAYIYGNKVKKFEERFADQMGMKYAVAVSSGTAALHTALVYLNPEPGDEIIVSPITDMGTVIPILYQQAIPVFVDVEKDSQNIDVELIESKINERTKAIIVTHIYGNPADMDSIIKIAQKYNLFVIEDCAQAHMSTYKGKIVGSIGHMGCFSLQQSKHITTGDGGVVITNEDMRFERQLRLCFDEGWPRGTDERDHYFLAPNYHMTELQAAVGLAQIEKYPVIIDKRCRTAARMDNYFINDPTFKPILARKDSKHTYFHYCIRIDINKIKVDTFTFIKALNAEGLKSNLGYPGRVPLYLYSMIKDKKTFGSSGWPFNSKATDKNWVFEPGLCPQAERSCLETIVLPWNEGFTDEDVDKMHEAIRKVERAYKV